MARGKKASLPDALMKTRELQQDRAALLEAQAQWTEDEHDDEDEHESLTPGLGLAPGFPFAPAFSQASREPLAPAVIYRPANLESMPMQLITQLVNLAN